MKIKDILPGRPINEIVYRMRGDGVEDELFGYCAWDGNRLISLDGDSYYLDEEILEYKYNDDGKLTVWIYAICGGIV